MQESLIADSVVPGLLKQAEGAALATGAYLLQKLGSAQVTAQKTARDDLLDADLEAEHLLLSSLRKLAPSLGILECWRAKP